MCHDQLFDEMDRIKHVQIFNEMLSLSLPYFGWKPRTRLVVEHSVCSPRMNVK